MNGALQVHQSTIAEAAMLMRFYLDNGDPVMLWGPPGIGKSAIVHQAEPSIIEYRTNIREPVDVRGIPIHCVKTNTTRWLVPNELPQVARDGKTGILFIDEINTGTAQMMAVMFGLVLDRKVGDYRLPDGWKIVAAGNRVSDRASAQRMPTALRNRFAHIQVAPDVDAWATWANANNIAPELVAFLRFRRELLHQMPKGDENAFPTPRSWSQCSKYINAPKRLRLRLFAGHVGDAYAAELEAFLELIASMTSLDEIIADPKNAPLPTEPSMRYAVCTALARMADKKNLPSIVTYAERLPRESQILVVHDATTRDKELKNTAVYGKWAVANQDVTFQN